MAKDPEQPKKPEETKGESQEKKVSRRAFARKAVGVGLGVIAGALGAKAGGYIPPQVGDVGHTEPKSNDESPAAEGADYDYCSIGGRPVDNCTGYGLTPYGNCNITGDYPDASCTPVGNTPDKGICDLHGLNPS